MSAPDYLQTIPLDRAVLCEDCRLITESKGPRCSYCGSLAVASLQGMLEKTSELKRLESQ